MRLVRLLSVFSLVLGAPVAAAAESDLRPLFELHDVHTLATGPALVATVDQNLFVARDGTVVVVSVNRGLLGNGPFATTIANGQAASEQMAALNVALAAVRPGRLSGVCSAELFPLGSSFRFKLTWFGQVSRSSRLTVTNDGTATQSCPPGIPDLIQAALELQRTVLIDPGTSLNAPTCTENDQCPVGLACCYPCGVAGCQNRCMPPASDGHCPAFP
jgi:hypothetical protein